MTTHMQSPQPITTSNNNKKSFWRKYLNRNNTPQNNQKQQANKRKHENQAVNNKNNQKKHSYEAMLGMASSQSYIYQPGQPVWSSRNYSHFAEEAYMRNCVAYRAINMIAQAISNVKLQLMYRDDFTNQRVSNNNPIMQLLRRPNPANSLGIFMEQIVASRMLSGNSYILAVGPAGQPPIELHILRPDAVSVIAGNNNLPAGYRLNVGQDARNYHDFMVNKTTGRSRILHLKSYHPLDNWYGMSPVEAAAYSIDQHNQAVSWNQSLLQNGARPTGAIIVHMDEHYNGELSEEQYERLRNQIDEQFSGAFNAGRPMLLEGGLDWKEMSHSPLDMDFINTKHSAARDIALAFGVPPQLLGIPGDNTYANLAEARLGLWEQTILPILDQILDGFNNWLIPEFVSGSELPQHISGGAGEYYLSYDINAISALAPRREAIWKRAIDADFLTDEQRQEMVGMGKNNDSKIMRP